MVSVFVILVFIWVSPHDRNQLKLECVSLAPDLIDISAILLDWWNSQFYISSLLIILDYKNGSFEKNKWRKPNNWFGICCLGFGICLDICLDFGILNFEFTQPKSIKSRVGAARSGPGYNWVRNHILLLQIVYFRYTINRVFNFQYKHPWNMLIQDRCKV